MHAMQKYVAGYTLVLDTKKFRHVSQVQLLHLKAYAIRVAFDARGNTFHLG